MRLMRVETEHGPLRVNPQHVGCLARDSLTWTRIILACPSLDTDDERGVRVRGTLDAIAAEWSAAMDEDETPAMQELQPLPYHLDLDNPPLGRCSECRRQTWIAADLETVCGMTQPDGSRCRGMFIAD